MVPMESVSHAVVCVSALAVCSSSVLAMAGRMAERPLVKNGDAKVSSPLRKYKQPVLLMRQNQHEGRGDYSPHGIAPDHDFAPVHAVEQHSGERPSEDGGQHARDHHAANGKPRAGKVQRQA